MSFLHFFNDFTFRFGGRIFGKKAGIRLRARVKTTEAMIEVKRKSFM